MDRDSARAKKRLEVERRRRRVIRMYRAGVTQQEIADKEGLSLRTIAADFAFMRAKWLADAQKDYAARQAEELARLNAIEEIAWTEWSRSLNRQKIKTTRRPTTGEDGQSAGMAVAEETTETLEPDGRYLDKIRQVIEARCRILGLYESERESEISGLADAIERVAKRFETYKHQGESGSSDSPVEDSKDDHQGGPETSGDPVSG